MTETRHFCDQVPSGDPGGPALMSRRAIAPCDPQEWAFYLTRIVDLAVSLLAGLCEEHGPDRAFSPQSPEHLLVRDLLGLVREAGGSVGLDALRLRLLSRLSEDLGVRELSTAMGDLSQWIADVAGGP